ncbi:MAG: PspC domain-containing protein [Erythrobacter sp.]|uniref:PspC domain-containing protein n=1 Tax=Erythrobacter sp. TaxID=1042 RepID=UPI0026261970|nr:PspC domain-containing protein [Erythrobacter sp.]MDJ0978752.1 PspC domain-containing protein [Erythrobacter sp.]
MNNITNRGDGGPPRKFRLDKTDAKLAGVCGGIANYFGMDAMIVRLIFVAATLFGFGSPIIIYLIIALIAD